MPNPTDTLTRIIDDCETFRLADDCIGVVWHEHDGWHGNLHCGTSRVTPIFLAPSPASSTRARPSAPRSSKKKHRGRCRKEKMK